MHDDQKLTAGDKVVQKMTRDGMVEQNLADKSSKRVSQRTEDATLVKQSRAVSADADLAAATRARKRRRAQRIRDADEAKNPQAEEAEELQNPVEEQAEEMRTPLREESVRTKVTLEAAPEKTAAAKRRKKRLYEEAAKKKTSRLSFDDEAQKKNTGTNRFTNSADLVAAEVRNQIRQKAESDADDNASVEAAGASGRLLEEGAAGVYRRTAARMQSKRSGSYELETAGAEHASRLQFEKAEESTEAVKAQAKRQQKKRLGREYASTWRAAKAAEAAGGAAAGKAVAEEAVKPSLATRLKNGVQRFAGNHKGVIVAMVCIVLAVVLFISMIGTMGAMISEAGSAVVRTTYLAADDEMLAVEDRYVELEEALQRQIDGIETTYPDYDEYRYQVDEIYHNPYYLISYFNAFYGSFKYEDVKDEVEEIFRLQYGLDITGERVTVTETTTVGLGESLGSVVTSGYCNCVICCGIWSGGPTASGVYPTAGHTLAVDASNPFVPIGTKVIMNGVEYTVEDTGNFARYGVQFDVYYDSHSAASAHGHRTWEAYLADDNSTETVEVTTTRTVNRLSTVMTGASLDEILRSRMTEDQIEQYEIYNASYGNRQDLFGTSGIQVPDGMSYDIPPEALSDPQFRNMITEAEKYLGMAYVWGGYSPTGGFDCSGFVSWVINHCGNGWNYGRLTAEGLRNACTYVSPADAKPGDLIFFQGTYNTSGASHVGIYVGNGMMIHCGNPIQYSSIETSYWQQHFYCFGRLP